MTEIVKKADAIRESRNGPSKPSGGSNSGAKERAKVVKKPSARVMRPNCELGKGDASLDQSQVCWVFFLTTIMFFGILLISHSTAANQS